MFRQISRNSANAVRRCANQYYSTSTSSAAHLASRRRLGFILGAAAVGTSYTLWKVNDSGSRIALDSQRPPAAERSPQKQKQKEAPIDVEPIAASQTTPDAAVPAPTTTLDTDPSPFSDASIPQSSDPESTSSTEPIKESLEATGEETSQQGAFNPETGEINWDCPCLGGMAHGPCGPQFREAFSCFIFSEEEPKGINCVELFKAMQDCFREHPEVYADEIMDDDDDDAVDGIAAAPGSTTPEGTPNAPTLGSGAEPPAPVAGSSTPSSSS